MTEIVNSIHVTNTIKFLPFVAVWTGDWLSVFCHVYGLWLEWRPWLQGRALSVLYTREDPFNPETDPLGARKGKETRKHSGWKWKCLRGIRQSESQNKKMIWKFVWETWTLSSQWEHSREKWEAAVSSLEGQVHWLSAQHSLQALLCDWPPLLKWSGATILPVIQESSFLLSLRCVFFSAITAHGFTFTFYVLFILQLIRHVTYGHTWLLVIFYSSFYHLLVFWRVGFIVRLSERAQSFLFICD